MEPHHHHHHLVALPPRHGVHGGLVVAVSFQVVHAGLLLQVCVVPQQLVHAAGEGEEDEEVEEGELHDVNHHPAQRHLQGPEVRVDGENVDKF